MVKRLPEDKVRLTVVLDRKAADKIADLAKLIGISKSQMAKNFIYIGLDHARVFRGLGLLQAGITLRNMYELIEEKVFEKGRFVENNYEDEDFEE